MISAKFLCGNIFFGGKLQVDIKILNFWIFESALCMKSVSMPLSIADTPVKYNFTFVVFKPVWYSALSHERQLIICSFWQDFSEEKGSSLQVICNAHTLFYDVGQMYTAVRCLMLETHLKMGTWCIFEAKFLEMGEGGGFVCHNDL